MNKNDFTFDTGVSLLEINFNSSSFKQVSVIVFWSQNGTLIEGINTVTASAADVSSNTAEVTIMVTYQP